MRAQAAGLAERRPRRSRHFAPAGVSPRGEFAAALATAALLAQLLLAPVTLAVAGGIFVYYWRDIHQKD